MIQSSAAHRAPAIDSIVVRSRSDNPASNVRRLRALPRVQTSIHAMLVCGHKFVPIEVRNVSRGGAGVRLAQALPLGEGVIVHFFDGRAIEARVVWSRLGFGGVEFSKKLDCDDELLGSVPRRKAANETAEIERPIPGQRPEKSQPQQYKSALLAKAERALHRFRTMIVGLFKSRELRRRIKRDQAMIEVACRKQGFSWLSP
jgi:PilZ domain